MNVVEIKAEFAAAGEAFNATWVKRQAASQAHLSGRGTFEAFLEAKQAHDASVVRYDAAFALMEQLPEEINEPAEPEQFNLFAA